MSQTIYRTAGVGVATDDGTIDLGTQRTVVRYSR